MRNFLVTIAMMLSVASPVSAKLGVQIRLKVEGDQGGMFEKSLRDGMEARLNSTERYTVTNDLQTADLVMDVACIVLENNGGIKTGIGCSSVAHYLPRKGLDFLTTPVEDATFMCVGGTNQSSYVVEEIINNFINGTTDAKLMEQKTAFRWGIKIWCGDHPEECVPVKK